MSLVQGDNWDLDRNQSSPTTGSMVLLYMVTFTINIPQMLAYIAYMDPMGMETAIQFQQES